MKYTLIKSCKKFEYYKCLIVLSALEKMLDRMKGEQK